MCMYVCKYMLMFRIFDLCFREYAFADVGNLEHCTKYLNQTLVTYGFQASLDLFANDPVRVDVDLRFGFEHHVVIYLFYFIYNCPCCAL